MKRVLTVLLLFCMLCTPLYGFADEASAYINNSNPKDRLHLRAEPSIKAQSLGKYYNGAPIEVLEQTNADWVNVCVGTGLGSQIGYMQRKYLSFSYSGMPVKSAMPEYISTKNFTVYTQPNSRSKVAGAMSAGHSCSLMGFSEGWSHILVHLPGEGDYSCFVPRTMPGLTLTNDAASQKMLAYISNPNAKDRLHLRVSASEKAKSLGKYYNGTVATLLSTTGNGKWAKVELYGRVGYMLMKYLTLDGQKNHTKYGIPTITAIAAKPVVYEKLDMKNGRTKALEQGTQLQVLGVIDDHWLHVQVGTVIGFIRQSQTDFTD
ncbi:MAG: SH3 domain-containing protein [Clostridia bacterium]